MGSASWSEPEKHLGQNNDNNALDPEVEARIAALRQEHTKEADETVTAEDAEIQSRIEALRNSEKSGGASEAEIVGEDGLSVDSIERRIEALRNQSDRENVPSEGAGVDSRRDIPEGVVMEDDLAKESIDDRIAALRESGQGRDAFDRQEPASYPSFDDQEPPAYPAGDDPQVAVMEGDQPLGNHRQDEQGRYLSIDDHHYRPSYPTTRIHGYQPRITPIYIHTHNNNNNIVRDTTQDNQ